MTEIGEYILDTEKNILLIHFDEEERFLSQKCFEFKGTYLYFTYPNFSNEKIKSGSFNNLIFSNKVHSIEIERIPILFENLKNEERKAVFNLSNSLKDSMRMEQEDVGLCVECEDLTTEKTEEYNRDDELPEESIGNKNVKVHNGCVKSLEERCKKIIKENRSKIIKKNL